MDWTFFLLLLPLASLSGYLLGRRGGARSTDQRVGELSRDYFRGLNFLLNEEQDKAIELFQQLAIVDSDGFDTQLALGNLFRRRGELERAIRLHQDLFTKALLTTEQRAIALLELGDDFVRAGLLDRAEGLFQDLLQIDAESPRALKHLIGIYEQEREWAKAIAMAERLQVLTGEATGELIAMYYCELFEIERENGNLLALQDLLQRALAAHGKSLRAHLLQARLELDRADPSAAELAIERAAALDPLYVDMVLPHLEALRKLDRARADALHERLIPSERGLALLLARSETLAIEQGTAAAAALLRSFLQRKPNLRVLARWLKLSPTTNCAQSDLGLMQDALAEVAEPKLSHRCASCGFGTRQLHWQCPSCKSWDSFKPIPL